MHLDWILPKYLWDQLNKVVNYILAEISRIYLFIYLIFYIYKKISRTQTVIQWTRHQKALNDKDKVVVGGEKA